jgi:hypothetical protein
MANTAIYKEDWTVKLQEVLDAPTFWKDVCRVDYTTSKVLHNPYQSKSAAASYTRGAQYTLADFTMTDDSVNINTSFVVPEFIDRADLAQTGYDMQMERAVRQAEEINLTIEETFVGDYASMTSFDNTELGGAAGDITATATNIDEIVRAVKKKILTANGGKMYARNGGFIIWDPKRFELLESFAQANGFVASDKALDGGANGVSGFDYMGFTHYVSNSLTTETSTTHVIAGVKKAYHIGILSSTYGALQVNYEDPNRQSGISVVSRVDFKGKVWTNMAPLLYNISVVA